MVRRRRRRLMELVRRFVLGLLVVPALACGEDPGPARPPASDGPGGEVPPPVVHAPPVPLPIEVLDERWGVPADLRTLAVDPAGNVWTATRDTLHVRPAGKRFFEEVPASIGIPERRITALGPAGAGVVVLGHDAGPATAVHLDAQGHLSSRSLDVTGYVHAIRFVDDAEGPRAVLAGAMGLAVIGTDGSVRARREPRPLSEEIWAIAVSPLGHLWSGTFDRLQRLPGSTPAHLGRSIDLEMELVVGVQDRTVALDACADGEVWAATLGNGVVRLSASGARLAHLVRARELPQDHVIAVACDPAGGAWMGTSWGGIVRQHPDGMLDYHTQDVGLPGDSIRAIVAVPDDQGGRAIWFATEGGLGVYTGR